MNIEAYNLDSLRGIVRKLQAENDKLKVKLEEAGIPFDLEDIFRNAITDGTIRPAQSSVVKKWHVRDVNIQIGRNLHWTKL